MSHRSALHPAVVVSHNMLVLHQGSVGKHLVHGHLLVVTVLPDGFLGDLDSVNHSIKTMSGLLHHTELSTGKLCQLEEFFLVPGRSVVEKRIFH